MSRTGDSRDVIADTQAAYFGAMLQNETLVPAGPARQGVLDFEHWLAQSEFAGRAGARNPH